MNQQYENKPEDLRKAQELCEGLSHYTWNDFAKSLIEFFNERRFLSAKQIEAGERMLKKAKANDWTRQTPPLPVVRFDDAELQSDQSVAPASIDIEEEEPF